MLIQRNISKQDFTKLLETFEIYTKYVLDISEYKNGYHCKNRIYYNDEYIICTESHLKYINLIKEDEYTSWKQVILRIDNDIKKGTKVTSDITGTSANNIVTKELLKNYSRDDIVNTLNSYNTEYDYDKRQYHLLNFGYGLNKITNCVGYDINGAHNDALRLIFPKSAKYFEKLYAERKEKPNNKKIANYYVGMLKHSYEGAYNWIVQRTTNKLINAIEETDGLVVYANTDGFITQSPAKLYKGSKELGEFKIEMTGDVYTYRDKNYYVIQYKDINGKIVLKGNVLSEVRDRINLFEGKVVHYDKIKNRFNQFEAINITEEIIKERVC